MCYAVKGGATPVQIANHYRSVCPDLPNPQFDDTALAQRAVQIAEDNNKLLNEAYTNFLVINGILLALLALPFIIRRSPGLFIIFRGLQRVQSSVAAQITVIGRQVAANESFFIQAQLVLRRAA